MVTHDPHAAERAKKLVHLEKGVLVDGTSQAKNEGIQVETSQGIKA
jgi:ABC-type lipoprotein export system ATPase subunit